MAAQHNFRKRAAAILGITMLGSLAAPFVAPAQAAPGSLADPAFAQIWDRTDKAVESRVVDRTWMWGPEGFNARYEPYMQGPGGQHLVQYFDKSRMEINNPAGDRNNPWYVTNGLLVVDMISGKIQSGDQQYIQAAPGNIPVAGDVSAYPETPTYASLARVASLDADKRAANRTGQNIREGLGRTGGIATLDNLAGYAKYGVYEPTLGHNIPDVFWSFLNQQGPIYQDGKYVNGPLMNWIYVMGYPITEPYWMRTKVEDQERWVLMQAFQRRVLTYSPFNREGWKVEMGNVGRAYYDWRYRQPAPTATPIPAAAITLDPPRGDATAPVQVNGHAFPAFAAVTIVVQKASANYSRNLLTLAADGAGNFSGRINIPTEAARLGELTITATANGGAVQASQIYVVKAIFTDVAEIPTNGNIHVYAVGQPAGQTVRLGVQIGNDPGAVSWVSTATVAGDRTFDTTFNIRNVAIGTIIRIVAEENGGARVTSREVRVISQPTLAVAPASGPANTTVTLRGTNWPKQRALMIGKRSADNKTDIWLPSQYATDVNGNISVQITVGPEYARSTQVRFIALDPSNGVRVEAVYTITR